LNHFAVIVVGASAGGVEALRQLAAGLPPDIPASIMVVQHIGAHSSRLPDLLCAVGPLPAMHPSHLQTIEPGNIYVAPSDHHLCVEGSRLHLTRGPRENWARPAIDPLFRSAAAAYGPCVIGVILTGMLDDGSAGLREVRLQGGIAVVQDPADAMMASMPTSALYHAGADYVVPLAEMPELLVRLAEGVVVETFAKLSDKSWRAST
jgi:two-component system, chemotaxis family, protein-glutamate methylesterase/glutaminase